MFEYPKTKKLDSKYVKFGKIIDDPFDWLEKENSSDVNKWIKEQNSLTQEYLSKIEDRDDMKEELVNLMDYNKYSLPIKRNRKVFFLKNDDITKQAVLCLRETKYSEDEILYDPNNEDSEGKISISGFQVNKDGKYLAYSISRSGSDWKEFRIIDIEEKKHLKDEIKGIKFSGIGFYKNGFFYPKFENYDDKDSLTSKNEFNRIYFHEIGDLEYNDELVYDNENENVMYSINTTKDEKFLIIAGAKSTNQNSLYIKDLVEGTSLIKVFDDFKSKNEVVGSIEDSLIIMTDRNCQNSKLLKFNIKSMNFTELVPEKENTLEFASIVADRIICGYLEKASSKIEVYDFKGKHTRNIELPSIGSAYGFVSDLGDNECFFVFESFIEPRNIYTYNVLENEMSIYIESEIKFDKEDYMIEQVEYESKDETNVPMFIIRKKDFKFNSENICLMSAYGGFGIPITPSFSPSKILLLKKGSIFAIPNLRGGGEFGEFWHKQGKREKKQNVFDDFISAGEYLVKEKYTSKNKLSIMGGSNGGLLVGACMTQRPDLFKVAIPIVGVMDMLKFHKFTVGHYWMDEYGNPDLEEDFKFIIKYSPLHNIKEGVKYPSTLVMTADHDDRVVPSHSYKFIATLQEKGYNFENPYLIRIDTNSGHGSGSTIIKKIDEIIDMYSFILENTK